MADYRAALARRLDGLTIGVIRHFHERDAVAGVRRRQRAERRLCRALSTLRCRTLEGLGARLVDLQLSPLVDYLDTNRLIMLAEAYALHEKPISANGRRLFGHHMFARIGLGAFLSAADYVEAMRQRRELVRRIRPRCWRTSMSWFRRMRPGRRRGSTQVVDLLDFRAGFLHRARTI